MHNAVLMKSASRHRRVTTRCSFLFISALLDVEMGENDTVDYFLLHLVSICRAAESARRSAGPHHN
jgi:hypothetical protein